MKKEELLKYADDWIEAMWNMDVIDHEHWDDGFEEAQASLRSYLEGNHIKFPKKHLFRLGKKLLVSKG